MKEEKVKKTSRVIKIITIALLIILALIVIAGIAGVFYVKNKLSKINYVDLEPSDIEINEGVKLTGYRNIAIFGVDSRADRYDDSRSDCIIIASINQETNDVKLISVYRDTYVNIDGHGLDKITHAYAYGGAELAINTLNKNLDLDITEFVTVNFGAVVDIIDAIGGVTINIESAELNYINSYIANIDSIEGTTTEKITKTGSQTLNGVQALAYSRIRYTSGGDYKRAERMRDVIIAAFEKVKTKSLTEINRLIDILLPEVYTNISSNEIVSTASQIATYNIDTSIGWPYNVKGITLDRWYGVPVTLESCVKQLHEEVFEETDYVVSDTVKEISTSIINKTGYKN